MGFFFNIIFIFLFVCQVVLLFFNRKLANIILKYTPVLPHFTI